MNKTGMIQTVEIYDQFNVLLIGHGYIEYDVETYKVRETFVGLNGKILEIGWYTIKVIGDGKLVILNRTIQ